MKVKPETAEYLRNTAKKYETSLTQLVIIAVTEYDTNHSDTTTTENRIDTTDTVTASAPEDNAQISRTPPPATVHRSSAGTSAGLRPQPEQ